MTHEEQTQQTKEALAAALKKNMTTTPFGSITVRSLIEECGINRKTFYYHFTDVYDLLVWTLTQETVRIMQKFDLITQYREAIAFALDYIENNQDFLKNIYQSIGRDVLKRCFHDEFIAFVRRLVLQAEAIYGIKADAEYETFLCEFCSDALAGMIFSSLTNPELRDPDRMTKYLTVTLRSAIAGSLLEMSGGGPLRGRALLD